MAAGPAGYRWDPAQYERFARERARPFHDLLARVELTAPDQVVDLGCGPGALTRTLADRWPHARVLGMDSSPAMIEAAEPLAVAGRLQFVLADIATWRPGGPVDVVVANALLHWVPGHLALLGEIAGWLAPGGVLAFQVPDNFADPSHTVISDLRNSVRWRDRLGGDAPAAVAAPAAYLDRLTSLGLDADVWQTTYLHLLPAGGAASPVLEWIKGTALRPVLDRLAADPAAAADFLAECGEALASAYPAGPHGTVFPFRRTFAVASRGR